MKISRADLRKLVEEAILEESKALSKATLDTACLSKQTVGTGTSALKQEVMQFQDARLVRESEDDEDIIGEPPGMPEPTA